MRWRYLSIARVADFFGSIEDGTLVLRLVYGLEPGSGYLVIEWPVDDSEYPPLSDIAPAAFVEECEVDEQFGVRPASGRPLNRLLIPPHAGEHFPRLGSPPKQEPPQVHAPHFVSGEAFEFPFGPVRAVAQESLYYGIVTSGEEVLDLYLLQWHKHRGIEHRLRGLDAERGLFFVERAEGLSAVGNGWAFCRAVEAIGSMSVSIEVECARAVALELERLYNHATAIAALAQSTGLSVGQAQAEIALEKFLRLNLATFGHRYLFGVLAIGGVTRPLDAGAVESLLPDAVGEFLRVVSSLVKNELVHGPPRSLRDRHPRSRPSVGPRRSGCSWIRAGFSTPGGTTHSGHLERMACSTAAPSRSRYVAPATCSADGGDGRRSQ